MVKYWRKTVMHVGSGRPARDSMRMDIPRTMTGHNRPFAVEAGSASLKCSNPATLGKVLATAKSHMMNRHKLSFPI